MYSSTAVMYIQHPSASSPSPSPLQWSLSQGGGSAAWAGSMWRQPDSHPSAVRYIYTHSHPTAVQCTCIGTCIHVHCILCLHPLMYMCIVHNIIRNRALCDVSLHVTVSRKLLYTLCAHEYMYMYMYIYTCTLLYR